MYLPCSSTAFGRDLTRRRSKFYLNLFDREIFTKHIKGLAVTSVLNLQANGLRRHCTESHRVHPQWRDVISDSNSTASKAANARHWYWWCPNTSILATHKGRPGQLENQWTTERLFLVQGRCEVLLMFLCSSMLSNLCVSDTCDIIASTLNSHRLHCP